jgi:GR25 family glycosyltransferase involved in LPS biosynthesis
MIPIYCINLKRATERKKEILNEWTSKRGIEINFFNGFDRKYIDFNDLPSPYKENLLKVKLEQRFSLCGRTYLSSGEICCVVSHCELLKFLIEKDVKEAIIIEDDAIPVFDSSNEFFQSIENCKEEHGQLDILLFHTPDPYSSDRLKILEEKNNFYVLKESTFCTQGIYYSQEGMKKYLESASKLIVPADSAWMLDIVDKGLLNLIKKPLIKHESITTYIHEQRACKTIFLH